MIKTRDYIGVIFFYSLVPFTSYFFIANPKSISVFFSVLLTNFCFLYFSRKIDMPNKEMFLPSILLMIFLLSHMLTNPYNLLNTFSMIAWIGLAFSIIYSYFSYLFNKKQIPTLFLITILYIHIFTTSIYLGLYLLEKDKNILYFLHPFIVFILPLPLAIHAHINKRDIEALFHLGYMIFAPIVFLFALPYKAISFFILCIPLLFVLKNCYLWYRRYTKERNNPNKD